MKRPEQGIGGLLDGLRRLAEGLGEISQQGERRLDIGGREGRMVFGYSLRTADGKGEAFGHVPTRPAEAPARQPIVDVIEEADNILVIAEMPGVAQDDIAARIEDGALVLDCQEATRWHKRITLPAPVLPDSLRLAARNGIVEIRMAKVAA